MCHVRWQTESCREVEILSDWQRTHHHIILWTMNKADIWGDPSRQYVELVAFGKNKHPLLYQRYPSSSIYLLPPTCAVTKGLPLHLQPPTHTALTYTHCNHPHTLQPPTHTASKGLPLHLLPPAYVTREDGWLTNLSKLPDSYCHGTQTMHATLAAGFVSQGSYIGLG